ncbi:MAG: 4'-phosphopantetheinyl transferase superfamily protein [Caldilineaceae bacterium]|nr:4'-phosphopantetheinyl transferase superfamily protein [Caldilineaceae bacterium]MBP8124640.1 4'-phosphopantetheinyl transferase superfamily protein [Caldilineaceae bacterium]MBP9070717.1 4'-phosphopantetheinyl transferase superfamily protein [Caldilineaceae bacterium]
MDHLLSNEVHIWSISLDQPDQIQPCSDLLCHEEAARAARFYFDRDRARYIVGRGQLRLILGQYTELPPERLRFVYNAYGKPSLDAHQNGLGVEFNLSHVGGHALCAVSQGCAVGIDVEEIRDLDYLQMAATVFSAHEQAVLRTLPAAQQPIAFFNGWTRKEAYIKAHGRGLSMPLADFDVTLAPGEPVRLLATRPDATGVKDWSLYGWRDDEGRVAALAVAGQNRRIMRQTAL